MPTRGAGFGKIQAPFPRPVAKFFHAELFKPYRSRSIASTRWPARDPTRKGISMATTRYKFSLRQVAAKRTMRSIIVLIGSLRLIFRYLGAPQRRDRAPGQKNSPFFPRLVS